MKQPALSRLVYDAADLWQVVVDRVIENNKRHAVFIGMPWDGDQPLLIKASGDEKQFSQLDNEVTANHFLRAVFRPEVCRIPQPYDVRCEDSLAAVAFEVVEADWYASKRPTLHLDRPMTDIELDDIAEVLRTLHELNEGEVPEHFLQLASGAYMDANYLQRFNEYMEPVLEGGHVTPEDYDDLMDIALKEKIRRRWQHHDVVPWNLGRDAANRLVLVDSEFARWGMAYYDVAYFYLQTRIMLGDQDLATRALKRFRGMFDEDLERGIFVPLAYRLAANLWIGVTESKPDQLARALELIPYVRARDFNGLLRSAP